MDRIKKCYNLEKKSLRCVVGLILRFRIVHWSVVSFCLHVALLFIGVSGFHGFLILESRPENTRLCLGRIGALEQTEGKGSVRTKRRVDVLTTFNGAEM